MKQTPALLQPGWWVVLALRISITGSSRSLVGQVQAVTPRGVRITGIDWLIGTASGWDFLVPWDNVLGMTVATHAHDLHDFGRMAAATQGRLDGHSEEQIRETLKTFEAR